jgi:ATP-dependent DNA helicase DinG
MARAERAEIESTLELSCGAMIRAANVTQPWAGAWPSPEPARPAPWRAERPERLAFAVLWSTGDDPARDVLVRLTALRVEPDGARRSFDELVAPPRAVHDPGEPLSARLVRDFGLHASDLSSARPADVVQGEWRTFLRGTTVITRSRPSWCAWWPKGTSERAPAALDLAEFQNLCLPGRPGSSTEALGDVVGTQRAARALLPKDLCTALGILVARVLAQPETVRAVLAHALRAASRALAREDDPRAADLELVLSLCEHPSAWRDPERALAPENYELRDGRLSGAAREYATLMTALDTAQPRWRRASEPGEASLPAVRLAEERTLGERDRRAVDEIFQEHLPRHFAAREGGHATARYRLGQHGVASVIADGFGRRELRLVHAPTGTGKTLAYLVPTMLWAFRNEARVAVATYTRALQEQAREREVPLALECLKAAAGVEGLRVAVLKGRENYLCWRALSLQARDGGDPPEELLAWTALALFALNDASGDLDRFSQRPPIGGLDPERYRRAAERMLRAVRSTTGCCTLSSDRATCAADAAWRAAERAHVVLTNHALVLARRDHFQHVVFDECEHLHDVALKAFSSSVGVRELAETLGRLHGGDERKPLARVLAVAPDGSEAAAAAEASVSALSAARAELGDLATQCAAFRAWRGEQLRERQESDQHSLFREYVERRGEALLACHGALIQALAALASALALLAEQLDGALPSRETPRLRRVLELLRLDLEEQRAAVGAWIPREARGRPAFGRETFHDLETSASGDDVLVTRVLLPHEVLGRTYYPTLAGAVFLSATTWLRGGFDTSAAYLGLARAAGPAPDEEREPFPLASFRAPEAFDYSRVLVALPRDAPPAADKAAHLDYSARFIAYLAERTRGRLLALFTNAEDVAAVGARLEPFFAARHIPFWWQRMRGVTKEELGQLFRTEVDSVLLGLDTFWYGADFPGETLEYLVIARLPYGVPDRYHHAQCAALTPSEQRRTIYLPRALAKFRQGFGRLMRKETDRGCVFVLDRRATDPRHRAFLGELPVRDALAAFEDPATPRQAVLVLGDTDRCVDAGLAHMSMKADVRRRGLERSFVGWSFP